ncbi:hypothetical protein M3Y97_00987500 [Aphelenchoides bicaudatus]|nr:hypothetical protein M3Y97_00987500 [Aphelenchoides bicaudatus]
MPKSSNAPLLDQKKMEGSYEWMVADQSNPDKLLIKTTFPRHITSENIYLHQVNIVAGKLTVLKSLTFEGNSRQNSLNFKDNKLTGIFLNEYTSTIRFMEWEILADSVKQITSFDIPLADSIDSNQKSNFIWIDNHFHMFTYMICDQVMLMKLDMEDQKMALVAILGLDVIKASKIVEDGDFVLWNFKQSNKTARLPQSYYRKTSKA